MNVERRLLSARALMALGRFDQALEFIEADKGPEAQDLRAEINWKLKNWAASGPLFEKALGERWKSPGPLTPDEEAKLLRASIAFSLAGDNASLARSPPAQPFRQLHRPVALARRPARLALCRLTQHRSCRPPTSPASAPTMTASRPG